ncbi:hypothetical signaling protein [Desulfocucumis palustris]|uniref:Hypothetical signaling protein n=1 Tax=Desulfocucumis palustris TaxID=1898651 RepID=A0A2L2XCV5_9FIRM|nr:S-layer homology domain-containing protein [Desulfocucumis palustris]GBF32056.1 hypothetical signaling protein [Desulfocucumis palustris]
MKKIFLLFSVFVLLLMPGAVFAETPFSDVGKHEAAADIEALYKKGIMAGVANNKFNPDEYVTRAQLAVCLVKTFGLNYDNLNFVKKPVPSDLYDDVEAEQWYGEASMIIGYNNIFKSDGRKFQPDKVVTRMDVASSLADSFKAGNLSVITTLMAPTYSDMDNLTKKEMSDINFVFNTSIMRYEGSQFRPGNKITRAELATILNQTLKTIETAKS